MHQLIDLEEPQVTCPCCDGRKVAHFPGQGIWKCWICKGKGTVDKSKAKTEPQWWRDKQLPV